MRDFYLCYPAILTNTLVPQLGLSSILQNQLGVALDALTVPVVVANVTILTDFVILDIPEDDSMSIILGRPFLNTAGAVIDCNKGNVTFHVNGNEHTVHFPRKQPQVHSINSIGKVPSIIFGGFEFPLPTVKKKYDILIIGDVHIPVEVT